MHVREWNPRELYYLLKKIGFNIVYISQQEDNIMRRKPQKPPIEENLGNQMFVIERNSNETSSILSKQQLKIIAIIILNTDIKIETVIDNCKYIMNQVDSVLILALEFYANLLDSCKGKIFKYKHPKDMQSNLQILIDQVPMGSWFLIQDAYEITSVLKFIEPEIKSLRDYIQKVDQSSDKFNAIPSTIFFANDMQGNYFDNNVEYKIYSENSWEQWKTHVAFPIKTHLNHNGKWEYEVSGSPVTNNILNRVKICKKEKGEIVLVQVTTDKGNSIITDVIFKGRNVYPYHLLMVRHHPQVHINKERAYKILTNENMQQVFGATIKNGYLHSYFRRFSQSTFLY